MAHLVDFWNTNERPLGIVELDRELYLVSVLIGNLLLLLVVLTALLRRRFPASLRLYMRLYNLMCNELLR